MLILGLLDEIFKLLNFSGKIACFQFLNAKIQIQNRIWMLNFCHLIFNIFVVRFRTKSVLKVDKKLFAGG